MLKQAASGVLGRTPPCEERNSTGKALRSLSARRSYVIGERVKRSLVCTSSVDVLPAALPDSLFEHPQPRLMVHSA